VEGKLTFSSSYAFRSKVLVLFIVKKIRDPEIIYPGSGGIKTPEAGSATLFRRRWYLDVWSVVKAEKNNTPLTILPWHSNASVLLTSVLVYVITVIAESKLLKSEIMFLEHMEENTF
jgi:hypothetical protein